MTEADGSVQAMFPQEARLRNLTYVFRLNFFLENEIILFYLVSEKTYIDMPLLFMSI
jgi:hypothetical protein